MKIRIPYGTRPGEKIIEEGLFACPYCRYRRPYVRKKLVRVSYVAFLSLSSGKPLAEYIQCGGCLNYFPVDIAEPAQQLKIELISGPLPPASLFEDWQTKYIDLHCESLIADDPQFKKMNSPLLKTCASNMQKAGVAIKLNLFEDAKGNMYNIIGFSNRYYEMSEELERKYKMPRDPDVADLHGRYTAAAKYLLSKLP